jgi:hypothetical protein
MLDKGELGCFDESYQALIERRRRRPDRFWLAVWLLREGHTTKDGLRFPSANLGTSAQPSWRTKRARIVPAAALRAR